MMCSLAAAEVAYCTTPDNDRTLRNIVRELALLNLMALKDHAGFKVFLAHLPDLAFDLIERTAELADGEWFFCHNCAMTCVKELGCTRCGEVWW